MPGLKSLWKLEFWFSSTLLFYLIFVACVLSEIGRDKLAPVDCNRVLRSTSGSYVVYLQTIIAHLASGGCNEYGS